LPKYVDTYVWNFQVNTQSAYFWAIVRKFAQSGHPERKVNVD
jgi:hypothetical protein